MALDERSGIAVVGAGTMGTGIAEVAARSGHQTVVVDRQAETLARSRSTIARSLAGQVAKGRLDEGARADILSRLVWTEDLAAAAQADLVVEAIVERLDVKTRLLAALEAVVGRGAILATNTSSLSIAALAAGLAHPERFVGLHFFNPVPAMKLVEIVPGAATSAEVCDRASALMKRWGKSPALVRDVPGFIVNRVARPYYAEAFAAWDDGIEPAAIDALLVEAGGFRMGPLALADLIGHDVNYAVAASVRDGYGERARFRLQDRQRALVEAGRLGRKSGRGVYDYSAATPAVAEIAPDGHVEAVRAGPEPRLLAPLLDRFDRAGLAIEGDEALEADTLGLAGGVLAISDGRPLAARAGCTFLLDDARDFARANLLGIACAEPAAAGGVAAIFREAGIGLVSLPDRPGLLVQRMLTQLANAAADALDDGVASAEDIGTAMRHGANYPESPLDWAARVGSARVAVILRAIAAATGDSIYRPSASFDRASG